MTLLLLTLSACDTPTCGDGAPGPVYRVARLQDNPLRAEPEAGFFPTIGAALQVSEPGTTICVAPGTWDEQLVLDRPGVRLIGAGADQTVLTLPVHWRGDGGGDGVVALASRELLLQDLTIEGGEIGLEVRAHSESQLQGLTLRGSQTGLQVDDPLQLTGTDLLLENHSLAAAVLTGEAALSVHLERVVVRDSGDATLSEAGGLVSDLPVRLVDASFRRNAGYRATDIAAQGGLDASGLDVLGAPAAGGPPRVVVEGPLRLSGATLETRGAAALVADCAGRDAWVENLAVVSAAGPWPADTLVLTDCSGQLAHTTLAHVDGSEGDNGLVLRGYGDLAVSNSVIAGHANPLATKTWWGDLRPDALFTGTIAQAGLLHAAPTGADLRPASDSPLIDAGITLDVGEDRDGHPRPQGAGPDVGAYERR